jgi:hypothetical protein
MGQEQLILFSPVALAIVLLGGVLICILPRKYVLPLLLTIAVFVSMRQRFIIFGLGFMVHRILLLFAWARVLAKGEFRDLASTKIDKVMIALCVWTTLAETFLWLTPAAFTYQVGNSFDILGMYFLCRITIREREDVMRVVFSLAVICTVVAGAMLVEHVTQKNWLSILGYVDPSEIRLGRIRCQGAFRHSILAGTFGAVLLPLFAACWWQGGRMRRLGIIGCIGSTIITLTSASGGPILSYAAGLFGLLAWRVRRQMGVIRWGLLLLLIGLQIVMKAPVWALLGRLTVIQGASAYHRYRVFDTFMNNIGEWWMLGVKSTEGWGYLTQDVTNQYLVVARHGGIVAVFLFLWVIVLAFRQVGAHLKEADEGQPNGILIWAFGAMLFAHCVSFFGISYWDQTALFWYLTLAATASLGLLARGDEIAETVEPEEERISQTAFSAELPVR